MEKYRELLPMQGYFVIAKDFRRMEDRISPNLTLNIRRFKTLLSEKPVSQFTSSESNMISLIKYELNEEDARRTKLYQKRNLDDYNKKMDNLEFKLSNIVPVDDVIEVHQYFDLIKSENEYYDFDRLNESINQVEGKYLLPFLQIISAFHFDERKDPSEYSIQERLEEKLPSYIKQAGEYTQDYVKALTTQANYETSPNAIMLIAEKIGKQLGFIPLNERFDNDVCIDGIDNSFYLKMVYKALNYQNWYRDNDVIKSLPELIKLNSPQEVEEIVRIAFEIDEKSFNFRDFNSTNIYSIYAGLKAGHHYAGACRDPIFAKELCDHIEKQYNFNAN